MSRLSYISSLLAAVLLSAASCSFTSKGNSSEYTYSIHPAVRANVADRKMAEYMRWHLQKRSKSRILSKDGIVVNIHVGDDFGGDYAIENLPEGGKILKAKDERTMTWLIYQFIKTIGYKDESVEVSDLPPSVIPDRDTVCTFPFEYRDIYMPTNQNPDNTTLLALNNLEYDWGLWGHNLSRVLGSNGSSTFGYSNMDQVMFAHQDGVMYKDQFCFSSTTLYDLTAQYIMDQYGDGTSSPTRITIGPNDNSHVCMCRRCMEMGNRENDATPAVVHFVEQLASRFPGHQFFITGGYSTVSTIPKHKLPSNVGVFLSAIEYFRTMDPANKSEAEFFKKLNSWKSVTSTIYVWDYIHNFDDYLTPYPVFYVLQDRFKKYHAAGVKGIFLNGSGYFYSIHQEMYTYVLAAILSNLDADIDYLVNQYYADAMPYIGPTFAKAFMGVEKRFRESGNILPLYGGIDDVLRTYIPGREFKKHYRDILRADPAKMNYRERIIFEKTKQFFAFSFLEISRLYGLGEEGFAQKIGDQWIVSPEIWSAVENLKYMTSEDDLYLLTGCENSAMDHMDRVNETGIYIADYENEVEFWLTSQMWDDDYLLQQPIKARYDGGSEVLTHLTDGVEGISQNYHWGWQILPQKGLVLELPADALKGHSGEFFISFLNYVRHRMSPPKSVEIWADGKKICNLVAEGLEYYDEGERVKMRGKAQFGQVSSVQMRFIPSNTRDLAIDEIFFK